MKIAKLILFFILLAFTETILGVTMMFIWRIINAPLNTLDRHLFEALIIILVNLWRLIFYSLPTLVAFYFYFNYFSLLKRYNVIVFSIFNAFVFAVLNFLYKFNKVLPTLEFSTDFFWITIISIFLAPIILGYLKFYKVLVMFP